MPRNGSYEEYTRRQAALAETASTWTTDVEWDQPRRLNPDRSFVPILLLILLADMLLAWICFHL